MNYGANSVFVTQSNKGGGGVAAAQNTTTGRVIRTDKQGQCSAVPWQCGSSTRNALHLFLFTPTQKPCLLAVSSACDLDFMACEEEG